MGSRRGESNHAAKKGNHIGLPLQAGEKARILTWHGLCRGREASAFY